MGGAYCLWAWCLVLCGLVFVMLGVTWRWNLDDGIGCRRNLSKNKKLRLDWKVQLHSVTDGVALVSQEKSYGSDIVRFTCWK